MKQHKSGFVALIGRANVGKSTLMNFFVDEKISIVSPKPQTTRNKIRSILTGDNFQIVFIDTPGLHKPSSKLGNFMVKSATSALNEADAVVYLVEPREKIHEADMAIISGFKKVTAPIFCAINKVDTVDKPGLLRVIAAYSAAFNFTGIVPLSALTGENTDGLLDAVKSVLPPGPQYFPPDMVTDQPERQIAAEIIREKALMFLQEEIPHGLAVEISSWKAEKVIHIGATIFAERDGHKGIIIGKGGEMLKKIGTSARRDIVRLLGEKVHLELWVKVKKNWRDNDILLKNLGYRED